MYLYNDNAPFILQLATRGARAADYHKFLVS